MRSARGTVAIGFMAARTRSTSPLLMPPSVPPERFEARWIRPSVSTISSCASEPRVRARVRSRDVAIALARPQDVSVSNLLAATVEEVRLQEGPYADVALAVGPGRLASMVTRESVERLLKVNADSFN